MNQPILVYTRRQKNRVARRLYLLLAAALLFFTACSLVNQSSSAPMLGHQARFQPQTEATITCSQECADRGACGTTANQESVVFGHAGNPVFDSYDLLFPDSSRVFINNVNMGNLQVVTTGEQFRIPFYHVTLVEQSKAGWVAGWCLAAP